MKIIQVKSIPHDEVEKDISRASLRVGQLINTLEESGFMNSERNRIFQNMMKELDKIMSDVIGDK